MCKFVQYAPEHGNDCVFNIDEIVFVEEVPPHLAFIIHFSNGFIQRFEFETPRDLIISYDRFKREVLNISNEADE
ncbi:hypothetical protein [Elizabethkingia ursingii]|uniref:hypothetical protein n=1 Tax=Elizabethkingia ursingii TaxID=1756150 RepID=UPI0020135587|nr:hypothetical protein [Elizabethkingia ursingii]MCL1671754.1 hypothetical protein [Elizabethkingia ursingii]